MEDELFAVELARFPRHFARCGIQQHVFATEREKIRALPHFAGIHGINGVLPGPLALRQPMEIFPLPQILRAIQNNVAANLARARSDAEVPGIALAPEKRIAKSSDPRMLRRF